MRAIAGQSFFLPGPSDAFHSYFNGNEEYERRFYSICYDSFLWSAGYWQQFEEIDRKWCKQQHKRQHQARKPSENCPIKGAAYLHFHIFYERSALASFERYINHLYIKLNCKKYCITLEIEKWQLFNPESILPPIHPGPLLRNHSSSGKNAQFTLLDKGPI